MDIELAGNILAMRDDRIDRYKELCRYFLIGKAAYNAAYKVFFTVRKCVVRLCLCGSVCCHHMGGMLLKQLDSGNKEGVLQLAVVMQVIIQIEQLCEYGIELLLMIWIRHVVILDDDVAQVDKLLVHAFMATDKVGDMEARHRVSADKALYRGA